MVKILARSLATVLGIVGTSLVLPVFVACWYGEYRALAGFAVPMAASWATAGWFWLRGRGKARIGGVQNAQSRGQPDKKNHLSGLHANLSLEYFYYYSDPSGPCRKMRVS